MPRVLARFVRIRKIHVFSDERPSKRSIPSRTASHVSAATSSAAAWFETYMRATRTSIAWYISISLRNASSSPARSAATSCASLCIVSTARA